jgi:hypothetical protein
VKEREIDDVLNEAAQAPHEVDSATLKRAADSIKASLHPVRHLPSTALLAGGLILVCAAVAVAAGASAGLYGLEKMTAVDRALIFCTLGVLSWIAATEFVKAMIPGSRRRISPGILLAAGVVALLTVFAFLFRDYHVEHFVSVGIVCLTTGFLYAIPAGALSWLVLRRGFSVNSVSAGLLAGMLGGLAGVAMLELHCPNFEAPHVLVWHTAVIPLSAAAGALAGWVFRFRGRPSANQSQA